MFQPFDLAQAYGQAEQIKGSRARNALMERQAVMQEQQFKQQQDQLDMQNRQGAITYLGKLAQAASQTQSPSQAWRAAAQDIQRFAPTEYADLAQTYGPSLEGLDDNDAAGLSQYVLRAAPFQAAPSESYRPLSAQEAAQFGLEGTGYQINEQTNKVSKIGGSGTTINMPGSQKSEDAEFGKFLVKDFENVATSAAGAAEELSRWQMLDAFEIPTGPGEEAKLFLRDNAAKVANAMGIEISPEKLARISDAKTYKSVTQDLLRSRLAAQKGPQTEGDAARMSQTLSQLDNPQEANQFIQQANIALAQRTIEQEQFYLNYREENGTLNGAKAAWNKFKQQTPLLAKNPNTKKPVFYTEFVETFLSANPGATKEDALNLWRQKYAR